MVRLVPPVPFEPEEYILPAGSQLYRVYSNRRQLTDFNPGHGTPSRFAFFGTIPFPTRDLRLASFTGDGLRVLQTEAKHVTATMASQYGRTVRWAEAAHAARFDGVSVTAGTLIRPMSFSATGYKPATYRR